MATDLTVLCVLKSGGSYDAEWVRKLRDGVTRNLTKSLRFACLSDVEVPCERIPLTEGWPGWWSKIELFKPGTITGPTLYLDLDTVVTGSLDPFCAIPDDFAMLRSFWQEDFVGSGVMWFKDGPPKGVYSKFAKMPQCYIEHHERARNGVYVGDQAFVWDALKGKIAKLDNLGIKSYKFHCTSGLPQGTAVVCFHGKPSPPEVKADWMARHWR